MQSIRFQPVSNLILIPIKVIGIDGNSFRDKVPLAHENWKY